MEVVSEAKTQPMQKSVSSTIMDSMGWINTKQSP